MTTLRPADPDDRAAVRNVVDGADLSLDVGVLDAALDHGDVYVAVSDAAIILGTLVCDGTEIVAVAVRRRRRGQGIGSALVRAASADRDRLVAEFDPAVGPFWESLGFEIERRPSGRLRGVR